ncbi:hypothetical protein ABZ802_31450 [Streptomyces sp. NPDC047737]
MADTRDPVQHVAEVIREAVTCERQQCTPRDHQKFVADNMQIAADRINNS